MRSKDFQIKSNTKVLFSSMIDVINVLNSYNIVSFLNYGALLGYVREKRLLPWNNDIELCAYLNDEFKNNIVSVMKNLKKKGYDISFHEYAGTLNIKKTNVDININLIWEKKDKFIRPHDTAAKRSTSNFFSFYLYWMASYMFVFKLGYTKKSISIFEYCKNGYIYLFARIPFKIRYRIYIFIIGISKIFGAKYLSTSFPKIYLTKLKTVDFNGFNVRIPSNYKDLLTYLYGNNWKVPKENWSFYDRKNKNETNIEFIDQRISVSDWKILNTNQN